MNKKYLSKKSGFTLIELLIVIAILGIAAGAILVSTGGSTSKAKVQAGKSSMNAILANMMICYDSSSSNTVYNEGEFVCANSTITDARWPSLSNSCVDVAAVAGSNVLTATCGGVDIVCDAALGSCI